MKFSISFKYSNVTFKNKETKETIAYDTKASEGNTFTFDNVDEDVVIGMLKGIKDKKASQLFAYDNLRTNFINVMARNKCKELYDKLDKGEWKVEDVAISNITIKDVEFTKPTMNAREAITVESRKRIAESYWMTDYKWDQPYEVAFTDGSTFTIPGETESPINFYRYYNNNSYKEIMRKTYGSGLELGKEIDHFNMPNGNVITMDDIQDELDFYYDELKAKHSFEESRKMKKLNITKEQFNRSNYFQKKYGKLEYVSESGRLFKTNKGKVLKFNESHEIAKEESLKEFYDWLKASTELDSGIHVRYHDNEDGTESMEMTFDDRFDWGDDVEDGNLPKEQSENYQHWLQMFKSKAKENGWEFRKDYDDTYDEYVLILISVDSSEKYDESYDEYDDEDDWMGDGQLHVFDYGEDFPFSEQYIVMYPSGSVLYTSVSGSVSYWDEGDTMSYSTRSEMEDNFATGDPETDEEHVPTEVSDLTSLPQRLKKMIVNAASSTGYDIDKDVANYL